jgi:MOSC domain-containing protein YiiM
VKLISVQIGQPQILKFNGQEVMTSFIKKPVRGPVQVHKTNLEGDGQADLKHHGGELRAAYAFSLDAYKNWPLKPADFEYGSFGENLTINSFSEDDLCIGDILKIGSAEFQITLPRIPCSKLNFRFQNAKALKTFTDYMRPGIYMRVLKTGQIKADDQVLVEQFEKSRVTVNEVYCKYMKKPVPPDLAERARQLKTISEKFRGFLSGDFTGK